MALNLALHFAIPAIQHCNVLIDVIDQHKSRISDERFWDWSSHTGKIKAIVSSIRIIGNAFNKEFTSKLDPEELRYHDKLGKIFKDTLNEKTSSFIDLMRNNCVQMMNQHLRTQLILAIDEITPYSTKRFFLDSTAVQLIGKEEKGSSLQIRACEFNETAAKCTELLGRLDSMKRREDLQALNQPFQEILSDIAQFRKGHEITFRTRLKPLDIVYYDRLIGIYFKNTQSKFCTIQELNEEEFALKSIKNELSRGLKGVIKLCNHYQPQLEMIVENEGSALSRLQLN